MKKMLIVIGAGLCLGISVFAAATAASTSDPLNGPVAFDGKNLIFPQGVGLSPVDISNLTFDLKSAPLDKEFVKGKIFEIQFNPHGHRGALRYAIFTRWTAEDKIEIFYYPISPAYPHDKTFLDCVPSSNSDEYVCVIRGRSTGNKYRWIFKDQKIAIKADDGGVADSMVAGEIPMPVREKYRQYDLNL